MLVAVEMVVVRKVVERQTGPERRDKPVVDTRLVVERPAALVQPELETARLVEAQPLLD